MPPAGKAASAQMTLWMGVGHHGVYRRRTCRAAVLIWVTETKLYMVFTAPEHADGDLSMADQRGGVGCTCDAADDHRCEMTFYYVLHAAGG